MTVESPHTVEASSVFVSAQDGLRLHVRTYGERTAARLPVMCLPGLTRTEADFEPLARALAGDAKRPRFVAALDSRGRGRSQHDRDPDNYNLAIELADVLAVLAALEFGPMVFIGTSRGGILTMLLAAARPTALAAAILNDVGPVIEGQGLMRIKSYVGKLPQPKTFAEGAEILRRLFDAQFPTLVEADWLNAAHLTWEERDGLLVTTHDPQLAKTLAGVDLDRPLQPLWAEFDALARVPLMVIRGANSDILSPTTVVEMQARRPDLVLVEVPDQGHPPLLRESETVSRIVDFIATLENA
jgi:pimeloyl-ACP methyl ester carboxylesterase